MFYYWKKPIQLNIYFNDNFTFGLRVTLSQQLGGCPLEHNQASNIMTLSTMLWMNLFLIGNITRIKPILKERKKKTYQD